MNIKPSHYTNKENGKWIEWSFCEISYLPDGNKAHRTIMINTNPIGPYKEVVHISVHSLLIPVDGGTPIRWDVKNGFNE